MNIPRRALFALAAVGIVLAACSSPPPIAESSYGGNPNNTVDVSGQWDFRVTTADAGGSSFDALMAGVNQKAQQSCHGQFTLTGYTLYDGTEATSQFLGLTQPWIEAHILCSAVERRWIGGAAALAVDQLAKDAPAAGFFDIHSEVLAAPYERAFDAVERVADRSEGIASADRNKGLIVSKYTEHGIPGFTHFNLFVIELDPETATTTRMTFKLLSYRWDVDEQNMIHHIPEDRDTVYERAAEFVQNVRGKLK